MNDTIDEIVNDLRLAFAVGDDGGLVDNQCAWVEIDCARCVITGLLAQVLRYLLPVLRTLACERKRDVLNILLFVLVQDHYLQRPIATVLCL